MSTPTNAAQIPADDCYFESVVCSVYYRHRRDCRNNACVESYFGSLKNEWVKGKIYETYEDGEKDVFKYIEVFYNRKRRHASLGYVSPEVHGEMHETKQD